MRVNGGTGVDEEWNLPVSNSNVLQNEDDVGKVDEADGL